jgi:hypothetical protein
MLSLRLRIEAADPRLHNKLPTDFEEQWLDDEGRLCLTAFEWDGVPCLFAPGIGLFALHESEIVATPLAENLEPVVEDTYRRVVLPLFLQLGGAQSLHGSAVASADGVTALCGRAGSGKSTAAAALTARGYRLWADDAVVIFNARSPRVIALGERLRLLPDSREHLQLTIEDPSCTAGETVPLQRIVILRPQPELGGGRPRCQQLSAADAFTAVVEHAYCYSFEANKESLVDFYLALLQSLPIYAFFYAKGLGRLSAAVDCLQDLIEGGDAEG